MRLVMLNCICIVIFISIAPVKHLANCFLQSQLRTLHVRNTLQGPYQMYTSHTTTTHMSSQRHAWKLASCLLAHCTSTSVPR